MDLSPNQMLRLAPNKVDYLIPGGEMINEFLGEGPGARVCSQMWIASLVTSALQPGTATGLSRVAGTDVFLSLSPSPSLGLPGGKPCGLAGRGSRRALGGQPGLSAQTAPLQGPPAAPDPSGRGAGAEVFRPALREG